MSRLTLRLLAGTGLAVLAVGILAAPASAHVAVSSPDAEPGGEVATVTFRVPNESDTATTTEFKLQLPTDKPMTFVQVQPLAGWTYTTTKTKLSPPATTEDGATVTQATGVVDWKATSTATGIKPGEFRLFTIAVGPLPKADQVTFKAIQTYSDGDQSAWIQTPDASGAEPENPAPVLSLAAGTDTGANAKKPAAPAASASTDTTSTVALILGAAGLLVGLAGFTLGLLTRKASKTPPPDTATP